MSSIYRQLERDVQPEVYTKGLGQVNYFDKEEHPCNKRDGIYQATPLIVAVAREKLADVEALCAIGASQVRPDIFGRVPMHYAVISGNEGIERVLRAFLDIGPVKDTMEKSPEDYRDCPAEERRELLHPYLEGK